MSASPLKILIVEDNDSLAQTLSWMLEAMGYAAIRIAPDARQAIAQAHADAPDVVLMDLGLPDMNGYEACRLMRTMPELAHTTFIAQTGRSSSEDKENAKAAGFHHFIVKPTPYEHLAQLLETVSA